MTEFRTYEPRRFKGAVPFYERYRLGYPDRLIRRVVALTGLAPGDAVLDLGSGPGSLAIPFARAGMQVTAADPEPGMLDAAAEAAQAAGVTLELWQGGSFEMTPDMGPYRLVTMGRAFHWMDRTATLAMLDRVVTPDGAIGFFHDTHPDIDDNRWFKVLRQVCDRFSKGEGVHVVERKVGAHRRYEPYVFASAFSLLDGLSVTLRRTITADDIVGRAFTISTTTPEKLGPRAPAFEADLRSSLAALSPDGDFIEIVEIVAQVARRP